MPRTYQKDNIIWKKEFGKILKHIFISYNLEYNDFASTYHWTPSTIRYWFIGRSLPQIKTLDKLKEFLFNNIKSDERIDESFYQYISDCFKELNVSNIYHYLRSNYPTINSFSSEILVVCYKFAKNDDSLFKLVEQQVFPTNKTQAVIFSFDGVLTDGKYNKTTWEHLWLSLGYDIKIYQKIYECFLHKEITYEEWCSSIEEQFRARHLHRQTIETMAKKIQLIKGVRDTFQELQERDIKIYIVSGSISMIIRTVLGRTLQYVENIKANQFRFNESGFLTKIISTQYDFEGKANFIKEVAYELKISPKDILFVGNSINDQFAYTSGARTLCINPHLTDPTNKNVWSDNILKCSDLSEILSYL